MALQWLSIALMTKTAPSLTGSAISHTVWPWSNSPQGCPARTFHAPCVPAFTFQNVTEHLQPLFPLPPPSSPSQIPKLKRKHHSSEFFPDVPVGTKPPLIVPHTMSLLWSSYHNINSYLSVVFWLAPVCSTKSEGPSRQALFFFSPWYPAHTNQCQAQMWGSQTAPEWLSGWPSTRSFPRVEGWPSHRLMNH